ncbi:uncharacterized protein LOC107607199 [Arachis ipaensis]|uniref:uncharacterized protein LOC107607199 n=1 Tax=Arachis ipaensis TaxID=130454 RepID=UPI0007AF3E74|nr:uncharacterized protein LOC107607199 [Arachis ipaensis]XP_025664875.1 uncharacterized protein LOC112763409 [Arachis hypogaea]
MGFRKLVANLKIKHQFTSVEHLQANGQVEAANKVILTGLKRRLQDAKGAWAQELPQILWAYRTTPHSTTGESPFRLAYRMEAMIPVEVEEESPRVILYNEDTNSQTQREELDLLLEVRESARIREEVLKHRMALRYNKKVVRQSFATNDLILIRNDIGADSLKSFLLRRINLRLKAKFIDRS